MNSEFLGMLAFGLLIATYGGWCRWSRVARRWFRREPPGYLRSILQFWGLSPDAAGWETMARTQGGLLFALGTLLAVIAVAGLVSGAQAPSLN